MPKGDNVLLREREQHSECKGGHAKCILFPTKARKEYVKIYPLWFFSLGFQEPTFISGRGGKEKKVVKREIRHFLLRLLLSREGRTSII